MVIGRSVKIMLSTDNDVMILKSLTWEIVLSIHAELSPDSICLISPLTLMHILVTSKVVVQRSAIENLSWTIHRFIHLILQKVEDGQSCEFVGGIEKLRRPVELLIVSCSARIRTQYNKIFRRNP